MSALLRFRGGGGDFGKSVGVRNTLPANNAGAIERINPWLWIGLPLPSDSATYLVLPGPSRDPGSSRPSPGRCRRMPLSQAESSGNGLLAPLVFSRASSVFLL